MNLFNSARRSSARAWLQSAVAAAALFAGATCSDTPPVAPRTVRPGHAAFSLAPRFAKLPPGAPTVPLSKVSADLTSSDGTHFTAEAPFVGDSAVLTFEVPISGSSAVFGLALTAFDTRGEVAYTSTQDLTLHPGDNPPPPTSDLVYSAPDAKVTAIKITSGALTLKSGSTASLAITGTNAGGQPISPIRVGWTSKDATIATVDQNGVVTAGVNQGSTTITALSASGATDAVSVKVQAPVNQVFLSPATLTMPRGKATTLTAELRDGGSHLIDDRTVSWSSSDPTVASVSAGTITANKIGTATISANAEGKSASISVTVVTPVDHIEITPASLQFTSFSQTLPLSVKLVPIAGASVEGLKPKFTSSLPAIATVDTNGVVTSAGTGLTKITATIDGITASLDATVIQVAAASTVSPHAASVTTLGGTATFTASFVDANGKKIDAPKVTWVSSDPTVATVTGTGPTAIVTALRAGSVTITATSDGKSDIATFAVAPVATTLIIKSDLSQVVPGQLAKLSAKLADNNGNPIADAVATFSTTTPTLGGIVGSQMIGIAPGDARVVATSGNLTAAATIKVVPGVGGDLIAIDDMNAFEDQSGMSGSPPSQLKFIDNLVHYTGTGPRASKQQLMISYGHNSYCQSTGECDQPRLSILVNYLTTTANFSVGIIAPASDFSLPVDPAYKVILLMNPTTPYSATEITNLKQFIAEGGRVVFVGEHGNYAGGAIIPVENDFFAKMGVATQTTSNVLNCLAGPLPQSSLRPHQLTVGMTSFNYPCGSDLILGPNDYPVIYDASGTQVFVAVLKPDATASGSRIMARAASVDPKAAAKPKVDGQNRPR